MNDAMLEKELENFDYSTIHPIKDKILKDLLKIQLETKAKPNITRSISLKRMNSGNLNQVAAAGDASIEGAELVNNSKPFIYNHFK